jgi:hypothetical protein
MPTRGSTRPFSRRRPRRGDFPRPIPISKTFHSKRNGGERIRSAFLASPGMLLVGVDYSQIELRVAAHLSGDSEMCAAFARGEDIHRRTASLVYDIAPDNVTDEMRRKAKAFQFRHYLRYGFLWTLAINRYDARRVGEIYPRIPRTFFGHSENLWRI